MIKSVAKSIFVIVFLMSIISCEDSNMEITFGIFNVIDDSTIEMDGEIGSATLDNFNALIADYPNITNINIKEVPGSGDDEINLQVSRKVHDLDIATHLADGGLIASGGVDFFLAGTARTMGVNTQIGVHSWSDGTNEATDFPVGDSNHQPYLDYYVSVGFHKQTLRHFIISPLMQHRLVTFIG